MRVVSSKLTWIHKRLFPVGGLLVVATQALLGRYQLALMLMPVLCGVFWLGSRLSFFAIGGDSLLVASGSRWETVPFEQVVAVYYYSGPPYGELIRLEIRADTETKQTIRFLPMAHPSMQLLGKDRPVCHPIADEIREAVAAAKRRQ